MSDYDSYLLSLADYYNSPCVPEVISARKEYEGPGEYSMDYTYNCDECFETSCEYWCEHRDCNECDNNHCEYNSEFNPQTEDFFANRNEVA